MGRTGPWPPISPAFFSVVLACDCRVSDHQAGKVVVSLSMRMETVSAGLWWKAGRALFHPTV